MKGDLPAVKDGRIVDHEGVAGKDELKKARCRNSNY